MGWLKRHKYYFIRYTFQYTNNKRTSGDGHLIIARRSRLGPPTFGEIKQWCEESTEEPVSMVLCTFQRLNKMEHDALCNKETPNPLS